MKNLLAFAAATAAAGLVSLSAHANVIDFANEADTNGERGEPDGTQLTIGGVLVQLDATGGSSYLDSGDAGLGVCGTLATINGVPNQCDPSSDDNVTAGESVKVTFVNGPLTVTGLSFRDLDHLSLDSDGTNTLTIATDLMAATSMTFAAATTMVFAGVSWISFAFDSTQFYVNAITAVPIPGALPLLLSGLAGLGFATRRRRKIA